MKQLPYLIGLLLLLSGCQNHLPLHENLPSELEQLNAWNIQGRMGYRSDNDGGSASVTWQQRPQQGRVLFSGPVGIGSAELTWNTHSASLATSKDTLLADNTETLAQHLIGVPVALELLTWWVRGLPSPHSTFSASHNAQGQLQTLEQDGWHIEYSDYQPIYRWQLPHRIRVRDHNRSVNLIIRSWEPLP